MALITCPNCGEQISDKAKTCIHCGAKSPCFLLYVGAPIRRTQSIISNLTIRL